MSARAWCGAAALGLALSLLAGGARAADQEWTVQSATSAGDLAFAITKDFTDSIEVLTAGRLAVRLVPVGGIVQYSETLDAVAAGILDGQVTATVYFSGKDPAFALLGDLIAAYDHPDQMLMFMRHGGGDELLRELYASHGLYYVGGTTTGKEAFVSKIPLNGVADFKGIKLRAPEGMAQDIFERLGAAPVNLPAAEVFTAVERGVVDAADWATFSMNHQLGFHAIANHPIYPGIHSMPIIDVSVNPASWEALPDDVKAILDMAVRDFARDITRRLELQDLDDVVAARAAGIDVIDWPAGERQKLRDIATGVWRDWSERSPMAARAYEAQIAFLRSIGLLAAD
jgi:TRAP-type mannitol/chloroaromatic compound transport system substrate-binding protein